MVGIRELYEENISTPRRPLIYLTSPCRSARLLTSLDNALTKWRRFGLSRMFSPLSGSFISVDELDSSVLRFLFGCENYSPNVHGVLIKGHDCVIYVYACSEDILSLRITKVYGPSIFFIR